MRLKLYAASQWFWVAAATYLHGEGGGGRVRKCMCELEGTERKVVSFAWKHAHSVLDVMV